MCTSSFRFYVFAFVFLKNVFNTYMYGYISKTAFEIIMFN